MPEFVKLPLVAVLAIGSLVLFVMAHLVLIAACEAVLVLAAIAGLCVLRRRALVVHDVPEHIAALGADAPASHVQTAADYPRSSMFPGMRPREAAPEPTPPFTRRRPARDTR